MMRAGLLSILRWCACLPALAGAAAAFAQNLPDPTRPPASMGSANEGAVQAPVAAMPVLQSVLISPTRRVAIINGQTVEQGDTIGDARVVRITEGAVTLRSGTDIQILKLFPGLEKRLSSGRPGEGRGTSGDNKGR